MLSRDFPDDHPPKRFGADGRPKTVSTCRHTVNRGGGCDWTGRLVRFEHGIRAFFRRGCKVAPSHTPVSCSSIPPVRAWLTGRTQSGRILKSADPLEDRSEELSRYGDFRKLERHVLGVPGDLGTDLDELLLQRGQRPLPHALWKCQPAEEVPEVVGQREV